MARINSSRTTEILEKFAAREGKTLGEYQASLEAEARGEIGLDHLTFDEAVQVQSLSVERATHLENCAYCRALVQDLTPRREYIELFREAVGATGRSGRRPWRNAQDKLSWPAVAAVFAFLGLGVGLALPKPVNYSRPPHSVITARGRQPHDTAIHEVEWRATPGKGAERKRSAVRPAADEVPTALLSSETAPAEILSIDTSAKTLTVKADWASGGKTPASLKTGDKVLLSYGQAARAESRDTGKASPDPPQ